MDKAAKTKLGVSCGLLAVAGVLLGRYFMDGRSVEKAFFYDVSQKRLIMAPRKSVPPIRGVDGPEEDAYRAVVISTNGTPEDRSSWTIAYLEKYAPELKRQIEGAQASGGSPEMGRLLAQQYRFVRRLTDTEWFPLASTEGEKIINAWAVPGPNGITPAVCTP